MSLSSREKQSANEDNDFEELPLSFEETNQIDPKIEAESPKTPAEPKKKSIEDRFSFPKALGELLGGFIVCMIGFAIGGSSPTNALALLGLLSMLKGIVTLIGSFIILGLQKTAIHNHSTKQESITATHNERKCHSCKKTISYNDKYCPKCGARQ